MRNRAWAVSMVGALALGTAACSPGSSGGSAKPTSAPPPGTLALVNGVAIDDQDVRVATRPRGRAHKETPAAVDTAAVLQTLIRRELIYQRAVELGLDKEPQYQAQLRQREAELAAFKRDAMADRFYGTQVAAKVAVTEEQARQYFQRERAQIRAELHIWQILVKGSAAPLESLQQRLKAGTSFEELARQRLGDKLATGSTPWDLGYLRWTQIPEPWRPVLARLKKGQVSDVIRGSTRRFWLIKLVDRRENPAVSYEQARPEIMTVLRRQATETLRESAVQALWAKARIVYPGQNPAAKTR